MALNQETLRRVLDYDPEIGLFNARFARPGPRTNSVGTYHSAGYIQIRVANGRYFAHRLAWLYVYGGWPKNQIDHINGIRDDNRISNLRDVSNKENIQNTTVARGNNLIGILGVSKRENRYIARITKDGKQLFIGSFSSPDDAHAAYLKVKNKFHANSFVARNING